jgi:hypothetical protein
MRLSLPRLFAAAPDAITAGVFLTAWADPSIGGPEMVKNLMLTMLIEFIVVHSSGFYAGIAALDKIGTYKRLGLLAGLGVFYMMFILAFAYAFDSTWPIFAFGWLFLCRFFHLWMRPALAARETESQMGLWAVSVATYVIGAMATTVLPLPALGITPEFIAAMHMPGSGEWVQRPYTVLAFGTLYFVVQAFAKYKATPLASAKLATI